MNEYATIVETGVVRFTRLLPGPIERVWDYLTESEKRGKWLASGQMELRLGGSVRLEFQHSNLSEEDDPIPEKYCDMKGGASHEGRITALDPPHLLGYTWGEVNEEASEVTFELTEQEDGVLLTLTHRLLPENEMVSVSSGWHTHLNILVDVMEGKSPKGFWRVHDRLEKEYEKKLG